MKTWLRVEVDTDERFAIGIFRFDEMGELLDIFDGTTAAGDEVIVQTDEDRDTLNRWHLDCPVKTVAEVEAAWFNEMAAMEVD